MNFALFFRRWLPALIPCLLLLPVRAAMGQEVPARLSEAAPVSIEADSLTYDRGTSTYHAEGQVHMQKGDLTLTADRVEWNTETGDAVARGEVKVTDPIGVMTGQELSLNLETGLGRLKQGRVFVRERNFHLAGEEIEKLGELDYRVTRGTFTTCEGEVPSWKFGAGRFDVTRGRYARARHVLFYVHDLPLLYAPFIIYPVKTERESGLLVPRYGYSQKRGTQLSLAWYQVIARNMDATFFLDYFSSLGVGKGIEYRYILGEDNEGEATLYHVSSFDDTDNRYALDWKHRGTLPGKVRLTADAEYVSSRDYFRDFGEEAEEYNKDKAQSVIAASRNWEKVNLTGQIKYTKDLQQNGDQTLQRLPEVDLAVIRRRLGETPFFFQFDGNSTYFWRKEGVRGERLDLRPALSVPFRVGGMLEVVPELGYQERLYSASNGGPDFERQGIVDFSTRVSTRVSRVFFPEGKVVKKIRHDVEPEILYGYIPLENQSSLPQFDARDTIGPENKIAYSLTNRLTARLEPENGEAFYHEFLYLRLTQDFDIRESRRDRLNPQDQLRPFSDVRAELIVRPTRWSLLDVDARYDVYSEQHDFFNRFLVFNARGRVQDGAGNAFSLDYRYQKEALEYLEAGVDLAWMKPVYVNYRHRYDFKAGKDLEKVLNLEYRAQCWSLFLTYRDRLEDREYLVTFALTGLGRVASFGGSLPRAEEETSSSGQ